MQNYTINREDGTINFFEQTFTIEDFKNRCVKYHENRDLSIYEPITLGEAETLIRLGYITVLFYDYIKCDDCMVVVYCEPQSDGNHSPQGVLTTLDAIGEALAELQN